ncbi:MAG TPA: CDP-glucose 4,6-dehydratase, partial [Bacillota bacterium]|nr:CDP-glucose 4,6-dehydratase [Bacillota bacterium]
SAYRSSFFNRDNYSKHQVAIASARAGNVIGGGDWATDRLIPDIIRALINGEKVQIRNPHAIRPWQHVLEPLSGYLCLAQKLYKFGPEYAEGWNFGPNDGDAKSVQWIVEQLCEYWGYGAGYKIDRGPHPHEANYLKLDCTKAKTQLGWQPRWRLEQALMKIVEWTHAYQKGKDLRELCFQQIKEYMQPKEVVL